MRPPEKRPYHKTVAVLTSMHGKETVIGPILREELGLIVGLALGVDTDRFGTFSREIGRAGSQLDAARAKVAAGFDYAPLARVGLASEGSFGPHPYIPLVAVGHEVVLMVDRETGLELTGFDSSPQTNFGHALARDLATAFEFARRSRFPEHGLIVMGCRDEQPAPDLLIDKEVSDTAALEAAVCKALSFTGAAFVETDMRAHRNPTRMAAISRATLDLVRRFRSRCPECDYPGFDVTKRVLGLPCAWCGEATTEPVGEILNCGSCGYQLDRPISPTALADPAMCAGCNP